MGRPAASGLTLARRTALGLAASAGIGALVGCSTEAEPTTDSPTASSPTEQPATTPADAPSRIATLDPFSTYNLFDLGLEPVVVQEGLDSVINPTYAERYAGIPKGGAYFELNLEAIAAEEPELILASSGQAEFEAELAKIATTVLITATTSSTWRQAASEVAEAVGHSDGLADLESAYEAHAAEIRGERAAILAELKWAMVWQGKPEGFSIRSALSNGGQVLDLAGIQWIEATQQADGDKDTALSWEDIDQLADADVICLPGSTSGTPNEQTTFIQDQTVFASLPAVKNNRVFVFDYMTPGSYLNATQLLDELDTALGDLA